MRRPVRAGGNLRTATKNFFTLAVARGASYTAGLTLTLSPILQVNAFAGSVQMSWSALAGAVLQEATTLSPPGDWTAATNTISTANGWSTTTVNDSSGTAFFRLKQ